MRFDTKDESEQVSQGKVWYIQWIKVFLILTFVLLSTKFQFISFKEEEELCFVNITITISTSLVYIRKSYPNIT